MSSSTGDEDSSVRVAVRIRPQIPREVIDMCRVCTSVTPGEPQVTLGSDKSFTYDYVFDMDTQQENVYSTCVESLINGSLEGYNATVLAYGQTGSGKTYTMGTGFDVEVQEDQIGIIPRAINHLFRGIEERGEKAREAGQPPPEFKVVAQFMELYNEEVIDLFDPSREQFASRGKGGIKIHEDASGGIYVVGVTMKPVLSAEDALQCLRMGALSRTTASTQMNSQSSRSHAIFTLHIKQQRLVKIEGADEGDSIVATDPSNEFETLTAKFHFVDLAGSERLKRTGATGERAKEGISINCGLLALGNVISALGDKSRRAMHVPYRDSKLTRLLQDSLGGNSQTVMIACVSPSDRDFMETLNTLKYANRARNIKNRVTINQDKSSRTIILLRQEIQQLQLELLEYKQGKRVLGEDGVETVNDMFHENTMLQTENNNLRTRVKAMQDTIDALSTKNTQLLAEKAMGGWIHSGGESDVSEMIQGYLKEIEELRAKLLESEAMCQQLRKTASRSPMRSALSPHVAMSGHYDISLGDTSSVGNLIAEAKKGLQKDMELLSKSTRGLHAEGESKKNGIEPTEDGEDDGAESDNSDSEEKAGENDEDSDSDTDTEDKEEENAHYGLELAELTSEIDIKQKLIDELERSQKRIQLMRQHYEDKLQLLQERIRATQQERDTVLASFTGQTNQPSEKEKKVRDEYERKLTDMQKEMKKLLSAKKEHARLLRNQIQHENQMKALKNDLAEMKRAKVKLVNKMKEEAAKHKDVEVRRNREIAQLRKESRKRENTIRSLEAEKRVKDAVLKRKQEEVTALRKMQRGPLSNKAAGRVGPRHASKRLSLTPKAVKQRWQYLEKNINKIAISKQMVASMERDMERQLQQREELSRSLDQLMRRRDHALISRQDASVIRDLEDQIESMKATIDYVQESIAESQQNIMQIEEGKENLDTLDVEGLMQGLADVDAKYLVEKLYNMTVNQSYSAAQKELTVKEMEAKNNELKQTNTTQQQLLEHLLNQLATKENLEVSSDESAHSSRSASPTDTCNGNVRPVNITSSHKIRRRTALPEELLYPLMSSQTQDRLTITELPSGSHDDYTLMPPPQTGVIVRVPSAPGSLSKSIIPSRPDQLKPSPVPSRKVYDRQESTSPRLTRRTVNIAQGSLFGKPGSMEQGLDGSGSPPSSPPAYRRLNSREENVFSRLTSGTTGASEQPIGRGIISVYTGKVPAKAPLVCTHVAEGHSRAVLSVFATDDLLFSASKDLALYYGDDRPKNRRKRNVHFKRDRCVKVWDLQAGQEVQTVLGHPNSVVVVKYNEESRLGFSVSSAYIRIWDLRENPVKTVKILCSSGLTMTNTSSISQSLPPGEIQLNDVALNHYGTVLYSAAGDRVRVWDLRKFESTGKLSGGHQAAVMCLAVGKLSEDEDVVITGSKDHYIKVFEVDRATSCNVYTPKMNLNPPHYDGIQSLAIRGDVLFSGSRDMCIKKWDLSKQELIQSLNNAHKDWVCGLTFMPGGQTILSGCRAGMVKLWSAESCHLLGEMKAHNSPINAITTNSSHVFTASNDGTVRTWKVRSRYDISPDASDGV